LPPPPGNVSVSKKNFLPKGQNLGLEIPVLWKFRDKIEIWGHR